MVVLGDLVLDTVATAPNSACAMDREGRLYCWGASWPRLPTPVVPDARFGSIAVATGRGCGIGLDGVARCCGIALDGRFLCWGDAPGGPGDVTPGEAFEPWPGARFVDADVGQGLLCAVDVEGWARCAGSNRLGAVGPDGRPNGPGRAPPFVRVGVTTHRWLWRDERSCGLTSGGDLHCWGRLRDDRVADECSGFTCARSPVPIPLASPFRTLSVSNGVQCGMAADGRAWCMGDPRTVGRGPPGQAPGCPGDGRAAGGDCIPPVPVFGQRAPGGTPKGPRG